MEPRVMQRLVIQRSAVCKHNADSIRLLFKLPKKSPRFSYSSMLSLPYAIGLLTDDHMNAHLTVYGES